MRGSICGAVIQISCPTAAASQSDISASGRRFKIALPGRPLIKSCRQFAFHCFYRLMVYILVGFLPIAHISVHDRLVGKGQIHGSRVFHIAAQRRFLPGIHRIQRIFTLRLQIPDLLCVSAGQIQIDRIARVNLFPPRRISRTGR